MLITVKVTQEHIDRGIPADCESCPVALALRDASPGPWSVGAYNADYMLSERRIRLPLTVTEWIYRFDGGYGGSPITFQLEV